MIGNLAGPMGTEAAVRLSFKAAARARMDAWAWRSGCVKLMTLSIAGSSGEGRGQPARGGLRVGSEQGGEAGQHHAAADDGDGRQQLAGDVEEAQGAAVRGVGADGRHGLPGLDRAGLVLVGQVAVAAIDGELTAGSAGRGGARTGTGWLKSGMRACVIVRAPEGSWRSGRW